MPPWQQEDFDSHPLSGETEPECATFNEELDVTLPPDSARIQCTLLSLSWTEVEASAGRSVGKQDVAASMQVQIQKPTCCSSAVPLIDCSEERTLRSHTVQTSNEKPFNAELPARGMLTLAPAAGISHQSSS